MAVTTTNNKPLNPRGNDQSPLAYNRAKLFSGKALSFDGVNDNVNLDGFTMAGDVATIVFYGQFDSTGYAIDINTQRFIIQNHNTFGFRVYNNNVWTAYGDTNRSELNFYAIVSDGTTQRAYYNGHQLGDDETVTALDWDSATQIKLGSDNAGSGSFLNGQLANFKIFNTALTAAQVADLYNNPEKIVPTGVEDTALKLWLPMMEGAGTTAYDGSGNGNHGTISGATWTHGIGSPVAQTAVIDWNKGSNLVPDVNNFNSAFEITTTTGLANDPAGRSNAVRFTKTTDTTPRYGFQTCGSATLLGNTDYVISLFYKYDGHAFTSSIEYNNSGHFDLSWVCNLNIAASGVTIAGAANCTASVQEYSNGWYRVIVQLTTGVSPSGIPQYLVKMQGNTGTSLLVAYAQLEQASSVGPLVPTFGTPQTSPVLLPQGLTSGRDITGVNLFENVRKQGALNLDGNSWAEVHDNASLDFGSGSWSLEAWIYFDDSNQKGILSRWYGSARAALLYKRTDRISLYSGQSSGTADFELINSGSISNGWKHIVGTYDSNDTKLRIYIDGSLNATSASFANAYNSNTNPLEIGRHNDSSLNSYTNDIAQPRIYNRALNASEIERNYNAGKNIYK